MKPASLIIDGSNLLCRAAFALPNLTLASGEACGGAWGLLNSVCAALDVTDADEVHVCWDGGRSPRRLGLLPTYKARRGEDLERQQRLSEIWEQADIADRVLMAAGAWVYRGPDVEADDVVALLALAVAASGDRDAVIVSNDADFHQLIRPGISVLSGAGSSAERLWRVSRSPRSMIGENALTTKVLTGCKSDNIPGVVPGLGATRAAALQEAILADARPWNREVLCEIILGEYTPPGYQDADHRNVTKAVNLLRSGDRDTTLDAVVRNYKLCDLNESLEWPEVADVALHPLLWDLEEMQQNGYAEALESVLEGYDWKPERFKALERLQ